MPNAWFLSDNEDVWAYITFWKIFKILCFEWAYELPHEAEKWFQPLSDISFREKKANRKMAVTFLKINIFWNGFFLATSTYSETSKNEVYLSKTHFWGITTPNSKQKIFFENLKMLNFYFMRIVALEVIFLIYVFLNHFYVSWNVQKWGLFTEN